MRAFLSLVLVALALPASAQTTFGVKLGLNAATISFEEEDGLESDEGGMSVDKQSRLGFAGGLTAAIPVSPAFSFRPEILYSQKGFVIDVDIDGGTSGGSTFPGINGRATFKANYLEIPLMVAYSVPTRSALDVAIEAGPSLAYKLNTRIDCDGDLGSGSITVAIFGVVCEADNARIRDFDLGGVLGLTVGSGPFGVGLRYTNSILAINEGTVGFDDNDARNQVFTVTGHYRFGGR